MIKQIKTIADNHPYALANPMPRTTPPNPMQEVKQDTLSISGFVISYGSTIYFLVNTKPTRRMTANKKNRNRQDATAKRIPDKVGPMAGANIMIKDVMPSAEPILFAGKTSKTTENIIGNTNPVPIPWINLPINKIEKVGANPLMSAPIKNAPNAKVDNFRIGNHFISREANGKTRPITNI